MVEVIELKVCGPNNHLQHHPYCGTPSASNTFLQPAKHNGMPPSHNPCDASNYNWVNYDTVKTNSQNIYQLTRLSLWILCKILQGTTNANLWEPFFLFLKLRGTHVFCFFCGAVDRVAQLTPLDNISDLARVLICFPRELKTNKI